jgi:hypothetical protein
MIINIIVTDAHFANIGKMAMASHYPPDGDLISTLILS